MLSILLPVYNFPCLDLVRDLAAQARQMDVPIEIICIDDCSSQYKEDNRPIQNIPACTYIELTENIGRSRIRNLLASKAQYDYVLFIDCDSKISTSGYIQNYIKEVQQYDIVAGGTLYESSPPSDTAYYLHWKYGSVREPKPDHRQDKVFTSNNFIIKKEIIEKYPFNEQIVRYGHEDSFFQMALEKDRLFIHYINNPVIHIGLETTVRFFAKTRESMMNLRDLYVGGAIAETDIPKIRLLKSYLRIKRYRAQTVFSIFYPLIHFLNYKINFSRHPNLLLLDLYKLAYFIRILAFTDENNS